MSQFVRAQVVIPDAGGLPEDARVNTWHFKGASGDETNLEVALDAGVRLDAFYTEIKEQFASVALLASATVKYYDMLDDEPRVPFLESPLGATNPGTTGSNMPWEVAMVLSFRAALSSGENAARRRGRIYLGPIQTYTSDISNVAAGNVDAIATAAWDELVTAAGDALWCVHSRAIATGAAVGGPYDGAYIPENVPGSFLPVQRVWVDDAFDTQRRRGKAATYRKTFSA